MSKVRINDLAREMEVKSRQILDVLGELGLGEGKTHSSSIEEHEAEKVRAHFQQGRAGGPSGRRCRLARFADYRSEDRSLARLQARRRDEGHSGQETGRGSRGPQKPRAAQQGGHGRAEGRRRSPRRPLCRLQHRLRLPPAGTAQDCAPAAPRAGDYSAFRSRPSPRSPRLGLSWPRLRQERYLRAP